jgi:hypothetical protein
VKCWLWIVVLAACARIESSGPPTARQLASACIKYSACGPSSVLGCINFADRAESDLSVYRPDEIRCLADNNSGDCAEVLACLGDECPRSTCQLGPCTNLGVRICNGSRIETCESDGILSSFDCGTYDEACVPTDFGPTCSRGVPCSISGCEGNTLLACNFEMLHAVDCGGLYSGGTCLAPAHRCGYADDCNAGEDPYCVGDVVHVCTLGDVIEIDCVAIGFAHCSNGACIANP